jgi:hypothetical protein
MLTVAVVFSLAITGLTSPSSGPAQSSLIRVFVEAEHDTNIEVDDLKTSAKDLSAALAAKKKALTLVDDRDKADVVVVVVDRAIEVPKVVMGVDVRPGRSASAGAPVSRAFLKLTVTSGPSKVDLKNKNMANDNPKGWKSAAEDLADQVEKWIDKNRTEILARRSSPQLVTLNFVQ